MRDKSSLTAKQADILHCLYSCIQEKGFPPSIREICSVVGLKSTSSVHSYLEALENKGYIVRENHSSRSIKLTPAALARMAPDSVPENAPQPQAPAEDVSAAPDADMVMVPVVGTVAAGVPILAEEHIESYFPVPAERLPNQQTFFLRVKGDSMVNAGILDKDLILVKQQQTAENGDIIVALLDDSATVKTFYKEKDHIRLQPQNDYMDPILVKDNLTILGKVIGDMRFF